MRHAAHVGTTKSWSRVVVLSLAIAAPLLLCPGGLYAQEAIFVAPNGNVGLGTASPEARLHIFGTATQDVFPALGPSPNGGPAFNFGYAGASFGRSAGFFNVRPDPLASGPRPALYFMTANLTRIVIDKDGNIGFGSNVGTFDPTFPLVHQDSGAHLAGGQWIPGSSRAIKHDIRELAAADARAAFEQLTPVRYRPNALPEEEFLGFIAEDVPDLVAYGDRTGLSPMDFVAVLTKVMQEQARVIDEQQQALAALTARLERLEQAQQH